MLSDRQELVTEFQGEKFFLRVRSIVVIDKSGEQASVPRGVLAPNTAFVFDAGTTSGIKVRGACPAFCTQKVGPLATRHGCLDEWVSSG